LSLSIEDAVAHVQKNTSNLHQKPPQTAFLTRVLPQNPALRQRGTQINQGPAKKVVWHEGLSRAAAWQLLLRAGFHFGTDLLAQQIDWNGLPLALEIPIRPAVTAWRTLKRGTNLMN
jgi:hypothetical protein